jgi:hypothetical protein
MTHTRTHTHVHTHTHTKGKKAESEDEDWEEEVEEAPSQRRAAGEVATEAAPQVGAPPRADHHTARITRAWVESRRRQLPAGIAGAGGTHTHTHTRQGFPSRSGNEIKGVRRAKKRWFWEGAFGKTVKKRSAGSFFAEDRCRIDEIFKTKKRQ